MVCFPHAGGGSSFFRSWPAALPEDVELAAVVLPGREDRIREARMRDIAEVADAVALVLEKQEDSPLILFGHSLGAAISVEVALRLERAGRPPLCLAVSSFPGPAKGVSQYLREPLSDDALLAELAALDAPGGHLLTDPQMREMFLPMLRADYDMLASYRPWQRRELSTPVLACAGRSDPTLRADDVNAWERATSGRFKARVFRGGHFYLVDERRLVVAEVVGFADRCLLDEKTPTQELMRSLKNAVGGDG